MKLTVALLCLTTTAPLAAQTTHSSPRRAAAPATHAAANCVALPDLSPKIPALPPSATCANVLFTLRIDPPVKVEYVAPSEASALQDTLGLTSETFSLLYVDLKPGTGEAAAPNKWYSIRYTGYLADGTVFDSNADKPDAAPFSFQYGAHQVISGWDTGFAGMHIGGKRRLFIPYQLAYGANGRPPSIPAKAMLVFDVELLGQSDSRPQPPAPPATSQQTPPPGSQPAPGSTAPKPQ